MFEKVQLQEMKFHRTASGSTAKSPFSTPQEHPLLVTLKMLNYLLRRSPWVCFKCSFLKTSLGFYSQRVKRNVAISGSRRQNYYQLQRKVKILQASKSAFFKNSKGMSTGNGEILFKICRGNHPFSLANWQLKSYCQGFSILQIRFFMRLSESVTSIVF